MTGISASREKTDVLRTRWKSADEGLRSKTTIRCNRMTLPLRNRHGEEREVVRGTTLTGTLRMAVALLDAYRTRGTVIDESSIKAWTDDWCETMSRYEAEYTYDNWISVCANGGPLFSNAMADDMDAIERIANGGAVNDQMLARNLEQFRQEEDEVVYVQYDSQLAAVLNNQERAVKVAILERGITTEGSTFSFALYRRKGGRGTMIEALSIATLIVDANALVTQSRFLREKIAGMEKDGVEPRAVLPVREQLNNCRDRVKELGQSLTIAKENHQMQFWPDEPSFHVA